MGQLTFQATLGGSVNLVGPNTASTLNLTLPSADGSSGQALTTNGSGTLAFSGVSLTTGVSGTLPIANGGTNSTATATAGGIGYGTGTAHAYTSAGTTGQVLTSAGSGAPTWSTPSSGALILLSSQTVTSNVSSVDFTSGFSSTYDQYVVQYFNVVAASNNANLFMRYYLNSSLITSGTYNYSGTYVGTTTVFSAYGNDVTQINLNSAQNTNDSVSNWSGDISIFGANTNFKVAGQSRSFKNNGSTYGSSQFVGFSNRTTGSLTGLSFYLASATSDITSGTFRLYGVSKS
jgi:hypothetical protein